MSAINTGLSGLLAAQTRLNVSANNVANAQSIVGQDDDGTKVNTPYQAQAVQQQSLAEGGVRALITPEKPASIPAYDPANLYANAEGIVQTPNVKPEDEAVNQLLAKNAYQANLKTIQAEQNTTDSLLDIVS